MTTTTRTWIEFDELEEGDIIHWGDPDDENASEIDALMPGFAVGGDAGNEGVRDVIDGGPLNDDTEGFVWNSYDHTCAYEQGGWVERHVESPVPPSIVYARDMGDTDWGNLKSGDIIWWDPNLRSIINLNPGFMIGDTRGEERPVIHDGPFNKDAVKSNFVWTQGAHGKAMARESGRVLRFPIPIVKLILDGALQPLFDDRGRCFVTMSHDPSYPYNEYTHDPHDFTQEVADSTPPTPTIHKGATMNKYRAIVVIDGLAEAESADHAQALAVSDLKNYLRGRGLDHFKSITIIAAPESA